MTSFTPSRYQAAIFSLVDDIILKKSDVRSIVVRAVAGSGKTTTLVQIATRLPSRMIRNAIFVAFNKEIVKELGDKLPEGFLSKTIHSIGFGVLRQHLGVRGKWEVDQYKNENMVKAQLARVPCAGLVDEEEIEQVISSTALLLDKAMLTLTDVTDMGAVQALIVHFEIELPRIEWSIAQLSFLLLRTAQIASTVISYTDMIYLPVALNAYFEQYALVMVDEAQDLNACQRKFVQQLRAEDGTMIFVGDPKQAIYGFAGADCDSIDQIIAETNAVSMPLDICYRCPASHIRLAQAIVPYIQAKDGADEGTVLYHKRDDLLDVINKGDMIVCRTTAPLIDAAYELIRGGIGAKVRGRDIGKSLNKIVDSVAKGNGFHFGIFFERLSYYQTTTCGKLEKKHNTEMMVASITDKCECLMAIYEEGCANGTIKTVGDLRAAVNNLFSDDSAVVMLSSIHKAKGLEAGRVILLGPEAMPHPMARSGWAVEQEGNLKYVALTRAMDTLILMSHRPKKAK